EIVLTAADEKTWRQTIWKVLQDFGEAILRGAAIGGATGFAASAAMNSVATFVGVKRAQSLIRQLVDVGVDEERLGRMSLGAAKILGKADTALAAGKADE